MGSSRRRQKVLHAASRREPECRPKRLCLASQHRIEDSVCVFVRYWRHMQHNAVVACLFQGHEIRTRQSYCYGKLDHDGAIIGQKLSAGQGFQRLWSTGIDSHHYNEQPSGSDLP